MKSVCFTGRRPEKLNFAVGSEKYQKLQMVIAKVIKRLYELDYKCFISGMARGFDLWAADVVCKIKENDKSVSLVCAIPCKNQVTSSWSDDEKRLYQEILSISDKVENVSTGNERGCFHKRNRYMVDNAEVVVCLYDGVKVGGTAYTVDYALKKNKIVIQINPDTLEVSFLSENKL